MTFVGLYKTQQMILTGQLHQVVQRVCPPQVQALTTHLGQFLVIYVTNLYYSLIVIPIILQMHSASAVLYIQE